MGGHRARHAVLATTDGGASWKVQKRDLFQDFESVTFANAQEGWVLTSGGAIEATTNGGASWNKQPLPKPGKGYERNLSAITFVNPQCGWVVGEKLHEVRPYSGSVVILDTTDGGATWKEQATPSLPGLLYSVYFADAHDGWAVGSTPFHRKPTGLILATTDGGAVWKVQGSGTSADQFNAVTFTDPRHGCVVGNTSTSPSSGLILTTSGGGTP